LFLLRRLRAFKVTDFGTNRKLIYHSLYRDLPPICSTAGLVSVLD